MRFGLIFLSVASLLKTAPPQSADAPVIRSTTHAVSLDLTVVDRQGNPVPNLTVADFVVTEDNIPQRIVSLEPSSNSHLQTPADSGPVGPSSASHSTAQQGPSSAQVVIILDELNTQFVDIAYARYSLKKFLKTQGVKLDAPTEFLALTDQGLKLVHDYTLDGSQLLSSLEHLPPREPFHLSVNGADSARESISLGALEQAALANVKSNRRTIIVWLSPGYPVIDKTNFIDPKLRERFERAVKNLSIELLDARVTIYSIDPRGVIVSADDAKNERLNGLGSSSPFGFGEMALGALAKETGGHAFYGRNDVDTQVALSLSQSAAFYTALYYPSNGNYAGQFRRIHVQVDKPELSVQTRSGYYAFPDAGPPTTDQINLALKRAMLTPLSYKAIPFSVAQFEENGKKRMDIKADGSALGLNPLPNRGFEFHLLVGVGRFVDGVLNSKALEYRGILSADDAKDMTNKMVHIKIDQPDKSDARELRVVLCDYKTGLTGTYTLTR